MLGVFSATYAAWTHPAMLSPTTAYESNPRVSRASQRESVTSYTTNFINKQPKAYGFSVEAESLTSSVIGTLSFVADVKPWKGASKQIILKAATSRGSDSYLGGVKSQFSRGLNAALLEGKRSPAQRSTPSTLHGMGFQASGFFLSSRRFTRRPPGKEKYPQHVLLSKVGLTVYHRFLMKGL